MATDLPLTLRPTEKGTKEGGVCPREGSWGRWWGTVMPAWRPGAVEHRRADLGNIGIHGKSHGEAELSSTPGITS